MNSSHWAHAHPSGAPDAAHALHDHLLAVAELAAQFAPPGSASLAELAGRWHDLGKYRPGFQRYIQTVNDPDAHIEHPVRDREKSHSAAGALWAHAQLFQPGDTAGVVATRVLQYLIAGHHAGLDNWHGGGDHGHGHGHGLAHRLAEARTQTEFEEAKAAATACATAAAHILPRGAAPLSLKDWPLGNEQAGDPGRFALWVRMLFSALVDADFLDTEAFMNPPQAAQRNGAPSMAALHATCTQHLAAFAERTAAAGLADTPVNRQRAAVLQQCRSKAGLPPGVFSLTVPTGGGKTLSSLAFALAHAEKHGLRRVVMAIPFTSIIEQTAQVFRQVFAPLAAQGFGDVVVEHHSNADSADGRETARSRLACENWDAPLIVTTNVQLFESLFARRTSRCRKLHRLQNSVLVLDEAQTLPPEFLQPIVDVLRYLVRDYGVTVLLCTATQPVLNRSTSVNAQRGLQRGLTAQGVGVTEIIDQPEALYAALERVEVRLPANLNQPTPWPELADELAQEDAVLAIVSRRADACELYQLLKSRCGSEGLWHLSALMCAQHRSDALAQIKAALVARREALARGEAAAPVRVVATSLVEAGVDVDFPVVYRALAGLDAIAQAAGRCNREGRLAGLGQVRVFVPPTPAPPGLMRLARDTCKKVWADAPAQPLALPLIDRYFKHLYNDSPLDKHRIADMLRLACDQKTLTLGVRFRDAAETFKLIDDKAGATVLVRYASPNAHEDINTLIGMLERDGPIRWLMRKLQRYAVTVYQHHVSALVKRGDIRELPGCPGVYVQLEDWDGFYDPVLGARVDSAPGDPLID
jgi:CRISPR-associated endonuclease/helicase Cas3